ncbi:MAG: hypothetical protein HEEMFOPI_00790 [Holosporales bacterium]
MIRLTYSFVFLLGFCAISFAEKKDSKTSIDITPHKMGFKHHMKTDEDHKLVEKSLKDVSVKVLKKAKRQDVLELLSPLMRLDDESVINELLDGKKTNAVGHFTKAKLSLISGKDVLKMYSDHKRAFLLDHVCFDDETETFIAVFRLPGDKHLKKVIKLKMTDLNIIHDDEDISTFLKDLIEKEENEIKKEEISSHTQDDEEDEPDHKPSSIFDRKVVVKKDPSIFDRRTVVTDEPSIFGNRGSDVVVVKTR